MAVALPRRSASTSPATAAVAILGLTVLAIWLLSGVAIGEILRFVAFEALYVGLPGSLLYVLLSPAPGGWLRVLAIGWPCGYAIEVGAFALTASLHARGALVLLPLVAILPAGALLASVGGRSRLLVLLHGLRGSAETSETDAQGQERGWERGREYLLVATAVSLGLLILALVYFAGSPLPAHAHSVAYFMDNVNEISYAAEARNHWPITSPWVAGLPAYYYTAAFMHMAAINQVTGVALSSVVLRLFPTAMILVIALQLWAISRALGRSYLLAPVAIALFVVVEDLNLDPTRPIASGVDVFGSLPFSSTYAFGATFFLGLLALVQRWLAAAEVEGTALPRGSWRTLVLFAILVFAAAVSKTSAVADLLGGICLYWLWCVVRRRASWAPVYAAVLTAGAFFSAYWLMLRGSSVSNLSLRPLDFMRYPVIAGAYIGNPMTWPSYGGRSPVWFVLLLVALIAVSLCALAPLVGALWLLVRRRGISDFIVFSTALFVVSLLAYFALGIPGDSEVDFLYYGYIAMVPIAALGLVRLGRETPQRMRRMVVRACAAVLAAGLVVAWSTQALAGASKTAWYVWYVAAYGAIALAVLIAVIKLEPHLALAIPARAGRILACCIPLVCTLGLVKPLAQAGPVAWKTILHRQTSPTDSPSLQGMTAPLYRGLIWVRDHTTPCDVLAVNNHYIDASHEKAYYLYYSAFTERRFFLEGWWSTPRGVFVANPYPARLSINNLAVLDGSAPALQKLAADGVSYVLIDKTHGGGAAEPASVSQLVFDNSALSVYRLRTPANTGQPRPGCGEVS